MQDNQIIKTLTYYKLSDSYYQVVGITTEDKYFIEGNVCSGLLKELIARGRKHKAKIKKSRKNILRQPDWEDDIAYEKEWNKDLIRALKQIAESATDAVEGY